MENKYYTPSIEEFHIGFEFESWIDAYPEGMWEEIICDWSDIDIICDMIEHEQTQFRNNIRVKYLDREDIESLGFKYNSWSDETSIIFEKDRYILFLYPNKTIAITDKNRSLKLKEGYYHYNLFRGTIKNKSELKVLLKQLNLY